MCLYTIPTSRYAQALDAIDASLSNALAKLAAYAKPVCGMPSALAESILSVHTAAWSDPDAGE
jgi:hypothetical protein